jgi:hypothetical protein
MQSGWRANDATTVVKSKMLQSNATSSGSKAKPPMYSFFSGGQHRIKCGKTPGTWKNLEDNKSYLDAKVINISSNLSPSFMQTENNWQMEVPHDPFGMQLLMYSIDRANLSCFIKSLTICE